MNPTLKDFFPVKLQMTVNMESMVNRLSIVYPYILVRRGDGITPAWLQLEKSVEAEWNHNRPSTVQPYRELSRGDRAHVDHEYLMRQLNTRCFGKPISQHQSLENWRSLETIELGYKQHTFRANMLGLRELIKAGVLEPGDKGEAFTVEAIGTSMVSVWAESVGAARRKLNEICDAIDHDVVMREHLPAYERDWNE